MYPVPVPADLDGGCTRYYISDDAYDSCKVSGQAATLMLVGRSRFNGIREHGTGTSHREARTNIRSRTLLSHTAHAVHGPGASSSAHHRVSTRCSVRYNIAYRRRHDTVATRETTRRTTPPAPPRHSPPAPAPRVRQCPARPPAYRIQQEL
jgi:hypothetical protein